MVVKMTRDLRREYHELLTQFGTAEHLSLRYYSTWRMHRPRGARTVASADVVRFDRICTTHCQRARHTPSRSTHRHSDQVRSDQSRMKMIK